MHTVLLATKLRIPPQPHHVVRRARLVDALEHDISRYKLTLISAPAGYGKTTLLSQWAHASRLPIAWLSVSEEDNDIERFLRYLLTGWERIQPSIGESPLGLLLGATSPKREAVLAAFINAAADTPDHLVFVLDDYHLIAEPSIHTALSFLLDHLPHTLHFVLASRAEPPLPLARYRARHELLELRADDVQFSLDETTAFVNHLMQLDFTHDDLVALQAQLEGWIAGLQLVALARKRRLTMTNTLVVSGRHRFIADFLSENVLAHLPDDMRRFLLQTSILDRLSGSLCDAVTTGENGQAMLETLERENLFLVSLDDQREWFRYHRLFSSFLHEELKRRYPDERIQLHRRAAHWYRAHGLLEQASRHAVDGNDAELVAQIGESYVSAMVLRGEFKLLARWVEALPEAWFSNHPMLGLARVATLMASGAPDAGARLLDQLEQRLMPAESEDACRQLARLTAIRCLVACMQQDLARAELYAGRALQDLPDADLTFRADTCQAIGDTYRAYGRWEEARGYYLKVLDLINEPSFHIRSAHVCGALADLDLRQGRLRDAAAHWRKALAVIQEPEIWGSLPLPLIGWVYIRMGEILYEWNDLAATGDYLARGLERAELGGDVQAMIAGYLVAGRMKLTASDVTAASECLERARPLVENASFPDWTDRFGRLRLECWLAQGRLRAAVEWADEMQRSGSRAGRPEGALAQLAMARALIAKGDAPSLERALVLLGRLLRAAKAEGRMGIAIEALALQALAHWRRGESTDAMTSLERTLRLAEPEGYVRLFADLGLPMARLLQAVRARDVMPEYVEKLLAAFGGASLSAPASRLRALPEPLSLREQEVLQLIAAGQTNREIAEALVISPETVKKHTGSIYGKLGVGNRTEAAARARELDLLD